MKSGLRKLFTGISLIAICACGAGCDPLDTLNRMLESEVMDKPYVSKEAEIYNKAVDDFFAALDNGDKDAIKGMFAESVRNVDEDLDEQIEKLISIYPGPTDINKRSGDSLSGEYSMDYGKDISTVDSTFPVVSNGKYYWCHFELTYENDEDASEIGVKQVLFYTADEKCLFRYAHDVKRTTEPGLIVYAERVIDSEVRCICGDPYRYTPADEPLTPEKIEEFLKHSKSYDDFVEAYGEPNADNIYQIYELEKENGQPRYAVIGVYDDTGIIYSVNVWDEFEWVYTLWKEKDETS